MSRVPLRWKLAGAFTAATAVVLAVVGVFLHVRLGAELDGTLRAGLRQRAADLVVVARDRQPGLGRGSLVEPGDDLAQVLDASGRVVDGAPGFDRTPLVSAAETRRALRRTLVVGERRIGDEGDRATLLAAPAGRRVVVVGASLEDRDDALRKLDGLLLVGLPVGLVLAALGGFLVAGRALRPIERMRARAAAIGSADLDRRLPEPAADDEVRRLAQTLNAMLARLEAAFSRERSFVADASHELRTPLASLKAELELALRPGRSPGELRAAVASADDETEHLIRLTEDLLTVARADARRLTLTREAVDVAALMGLVAGRARVTVAVDVPADLVVEGDPLRLQQALGNLVDNAHRHGAAPVTMRAVPSPDTIRLEVEDRGRGVPDDLRERAFERFTRGDEAREGPGAGLGLAIVAAIAEAHGGCTGVDDAPGGGTVAWVELPRSGSGQARSA